MAALAIIAFLGALVLGFLGGRDSMMSELKDAHVEIDKLKTEIDILKGEVK